MQTQQLRRLQDIACLADHHSNLYEQDEFPAAVAASCVPAQRMPAAPCKPKILHAHTHCALIDYLHTPHSGEIGKLYTHNIHPHCAASADILHTHEHNLDKLTHPHCDNLHTHTTLSPHNVEDFTPLGSLGRGNMGTVILVLSKHSPRCPFALKITHPLSSKKQRSHVEREILSSLHHPFLQTLHAHFEFGNHSLLLLDFCSGGDLNLLRHRQPEKRFSETAARFYAAEVLVALEHLHKLGIVYRDLKPENILVQGSGHIKLTDFDLSLKLGGAEQKAAPPHATMRPPICSLQQQLEAEADAHLQLQAGKQSLHCGGFACLRGYTSRRKESILQRGLSNPTIEEKVFGCWITKGGESYFSRRKEGLKCLYGTREARDKSSSRTRKTGANEGGLTRRNKCVGGRETRNPRKSTKSELHMSCLPCFKGKQEIHVEERSVYVVGTDEYVAPEVLRGDEHGFSMDWWSFGILLYEMIYGHTPFKGATTEETLCNILEKKPELPGMKSPVKHLISQLLVKDPGARLGATGAQSIKQHPFFCGLNWESLPHLSRPPFLPSPLCLSELEERYSAKLKAKRDAQNEHGLPNTCKSWLDEVIESMEVAENSSQYSHTSSSAGFMSSSADGADRELRRDDDADTLFSSAEWSSELDVCVQHPPP